ncbi:MAG: hypothetical protein VB876_02310, partial [Pirellulales bacterium]
MRELQKYANRTALGSSLKFVSVIFWLAATAAAAASDELAIVAKVEHQPLVAATGRLLEALDYVGAPLPA